MADRTLPALPALATATVLVVVVVALDVSSGVSVSSTTLAFVCGTFFVSMALTVSCVTARASCCRSLASPLHLKQLAVTTSLNLTRTFLAR